MDPAEAKSPRPAPSGVIVPRQATRKARLIAWLIGAFIRCINSTLRFHWKDDSGLLGGRFDGPVIFAIWHNRLALCLLIYQRFLRLTGQREKRRLAAMVSASRDGGMLARILQNFGVQPVRGSSSRRGPQALLEMTTWADKGYDLAVTPDGPRGPRYKVQPGAVAIARLTGLPIIPVSYHLSWKLRLKTWDRFQIPLPFAQCTIRLGESLTVPREADEAARQEAVEELERRLNAVTQD